MASYSFLGVPLSTIQIERAGLVNFQSLSIKREYTESKQCAVDEHPGNLTGTTVQNVCWQTPYLHSYPPPKKT